MIPASMSRGLPRLRFESAEDEHHFDKGSQASRLRHFLISGWVSLLIFNGFLVVDWLVSPDVFALGVLVRLMIFTSFGIATMLVALAVPAGGAGPAIRLRRRHGGHDRCAGGPERGRRAEQPGHA